MKRYIFLVATIVSVLSGSAQTPIEQILNSVAENNSRIKATQQEAVAAQTELSAENSLENPTFEFEYMWGEKQVPGGNKYAFAIMQGFDFPSLYVQRRKLINAQNALGASQVDYTRRNVLLEARELCIKIVYLNKQIAIVEERVEIANSLVTLYRQRLEAGDANQLDVNKVIIEQLSQSSRLKMLYGQLEVAKAALVACNGGIMPHTDLAQLAQYPIMAQPASLDEAIKMWQESDAEIKMLQNQLQVAQSLSSVSKQGWIPRFEVGYKQAYEVGDMFYGLAVGVSLPLFKTSNEVKSANARALAASLQATETNVQVTAEATQLYKEVCALHDALIEYQQLIEQNNRNMLLKALECGQISLLEYMSDIAQINAAEENRLLLEYQYYSKLSQLDRNSL